MLMGRTTSPIPACLSSEDQLFKFLLTQAHVRIPESPKQEPIEPWQFPQPPAQLSFELTLALARPDLPLPKGLHNPLRRSVNMGAVLEHAATALRKPSSSAASCSSVRHRP